MTLRTLVRLSAGLVWGAAATCQAAPDAAHGEQVYARCLACHALAADRVGPRHCGLLGRRAGSVPGFAYSQAMKSSKLTWDEQTLDRFLAKPLKVVPGTAMTYDGVPDAKDRADLIAYLRKAGQGAECAKAK
jgi:cytochrome c